MIETIGDEIYLMATAVVGIVMYMVLGYIIANQKNPEMKFDVNYVYSAIFMIFTVAVLYSDPVEIVTIQMILQAFLVGYGGNGAVTKVAKISPTPGQTLGDK